MDEPRLAGATVTTLRFTRRPSAGAAASALLLAGLVLVGCDTEQAGEDQRRGNDAGPDMDHASMDGAEARDGQHPHDDAASMSSDQIREMLAGESVAASDPLPMSWRQLVSDAQAGRIEMSADGVPVSLDTRTRKPSEHGHFLVSLEAPDDGVDMNRISTWEIAVSTPDGAPVRDARIDIVGGMPLHNHGFPTDPGVGEELRPGVYPLRGVRFSMGGWWQVLLAISADGTTDTVAFDLVVTP